MAAFHDFSDFERLVGAAKADGPTAYLIVLLGGEAGLRCGEMMALEWWDVDLAKRQLCVARSEWKGHVTAPKGGRVRHVPLTERLADALKAIRHLRGPRVLCDEKGQPLTQKIVQGRFDESRRRAKVKPGVHILRHTFCSHLAMQGAPARAIQELAGHQDLAHDAAVHAPESGGDRGGDSAAGTAGEPARQSWRHSGGDGNIGPESPISLRESGGGGGSRTRVREYVPVGLYMRVRF